MFGKQKRKHAAKMTNMDIRSKNVILINFQNLKKIYILTSFEINEMN